MDSSEGPPIGASGRLLVQKLPDGPVFAIELRIPHLPESSDGTPSMSSNGFLRAVSIAAARTGAEMWAMHPVSAADGTSVLGQQVRRLLPDGEVLPGRVTALRGAAKLVSGDAREVVATDLVEVTFDESRHEPGQDEVPLPALCAKDAGRIVLNDANEAIGLVIAGTGHVAAVAPIRTFLLANDFKLIDPAAFGAEAAREVAKQRFEEDARSLIDMLAVGERLTLPELESLP
jgi:hypothetical protein